MATSWSEEVEEFLTPQRGVSKFDWRCGRGHFQSLMLGTTCRKCGSEIRLPHGYNNALEAILGIGEDESEAMTPGSAEAMTLTESSQNTPEELQPQPGTSRHSDSRDDLYDFGLVKCVQGHIFPNSYHHCNICGGMPIDNVIKELDEAAKESEPSGRVVDEFGLTQCSKGHVFHISSNTCNVCDPDKAIVESGEDKKHVTFEEDKNEAMGAFGRRPKYSPRSVRPMLSQMISNYHWERYSGDKEQGQSTSTSCKRIDEDEEEQEE